MVDSNHSIDSNTSGCASVKSNGSQPSVPTIQIILEEKNKLIDQLRKQLLNQRTQLEFYIRKDLHTPKMLDLAKNCIIEAAPDDIKTTIAMNKFNKDIGIKSRMMYLYERTVKIGDKVREGVNRLESLLQVVADKLQRSMGPREIQTFLENFDVNTNHIELFNLLVNSTTILNKNVEELKNSCARLGSVEEKRNAIVEQIYSLPLEERTICNYLIGVQMEKFELEHIVKDISKKQQRQEFSDEVNTVENNLKLLYHKYGNEYGSSGNEHTLPLMLDKMYSEAMSLLTLIKEQKQSYSKDMLQLKEENEKLRKLVHNIEVKQKEYGKSTMNNVSDVEKLHNLIKKTLIYAKEVDPEKADTDNRIIEDRLTEDNIKLLIRQ